LAAARAERSSKLESGKVSVDSGRVDTTTVEPVLDLDQMPVLGDIARYHARTRPRRITLSFEGRETTFKELDRHSNQVANALIAEGVRKGERISYFGKNSDHYFEILLGAAKAGVVLTPIGWRLAPEEVSFILEDCGASVVFVGPEVMSHAQKALSGFKGNLKMIAMEQVAQVGIALYEKWRDAAPDSDAGVFVEPADVALQVYTSGTTGRPKGALLTHSNILAGRRKAARAGMAWYNWKPDDVGLVALPLSHIGGTTAALLGIYHGAKTVIAREFDPLEVLNYIEREAISQLFMVPATLQLIVRQPKVRQVDFSRLKLIHYGASPIPLELLRECTDVFGCGFCQQYGMTETSGTIVYLPPEDHRPDDNPHMRAAGRPMPGVELKIADSDGNALPPNILGEIATRSVANMMGYWRLEDATKATIDAQGWLRTGDAGYLDEDGYLYIHDRVKDMIISGAENIYPAEVENAIYGHPHVAEVAVIGVPDEKWGEAVKAVVVLKPGITPNPDDIIAFARSRIAAFKAPKSIDFIDALPRSASGKILRRMLREPYWVARARAVN
jgi:acyl-CoA synthetase (AMP-forming)/AMP-acid ligase II